MRQPARYLALHAHPIRNNGKRRDWIGAEVGGKGGGGGRGSRDTSAGGGSAGTGGHLGEIGTRSATAC